MVDLILLAVVVQRLGVAVVARGVLTHGWLAAYVLGEALLVDVVPEADHEVEVLLGQVAVRGVEAGDELLTREEPDPDRLTGALRPRGAEPAGRRVLVLGLEAVEVLVAWLQPRHARLGREVELLRDDRLAVAHDVLEVLVPGHLPPDDRAVVDALDPRPQGDAAGGGLAGGHALLEAPALGQRDAVGPGLLEVAEGGQGRARGDGHRTGASGRAPEEPAPVVALFAHLALPPVGQACRLQAASTPLRARRPQRIDRGDRDRVKGR